MLFDVCFKAHNRYLADVKIFIFKTPTTQGTECV